jgi:hypothetical protein
MIRSMAAAVAVALLSAPIAAHAADPNGATAPPHTMTAQPAAAPEVSAPASAYVPATPTVRSYDAKAASENIQPVATELVTNGPIPDTPANRARYGGPNSAGGRATSASGD